MSDKHRWADPDWEWLPQVGYDDKPFGSQAVATGILLGVMGVAAVVAALWHLI